MFVFGQRTDKNWGFHTPYCTTFPIISDGNALVTYLFDEGNLYRQHPYQVELLQTVISKHKSHFLRVVQHILAHYWPERDRYVVSEATLARYIDEFPERLQEVINRLHLSFRASPR